MAARDWKECEGERRGLEEGQFDVSVEGLG